MKKIVVSIVLVEVGSLVVVTLFAIVVPWASHQLGTLIAKLLRPVFILVRFRTVLCQHCLRTTTPLHARYALGKRMCEHCGGVVSAALAPGQLIVTFGVHSPSIPERVFELRNPDATHWQHPVAVSAIYIDPATCDSSLLERWLTYLLHYCPKKHVHGITVGILGASAHLGENLSNVLQNTFSHISVLPVSAFTTFPPGGRGIWGQEATAPVCLEKVLRPPLPSKPGWRHRMRAAWHRLGASDWRRGVIGSMMGAILGGILVILVVLAGTSVRRNIQPALMRSPVLALLIGGGLQSIAYGWHQGLRQQLLPSRQTLRRFVFWGKRPLDDDVSELE